MIFEVPWYYWLILLAAIILAVFVWIKALKSGKERRERLKKEAEIWKKEYELREEFKVLSKEKINSSQNSKLLKGVCMNIQIFLEKETDMEKSFLLLPLEKQYIYALNYFDEDASKSLSFFFKQNSPPLTTVLCDSLRAVGYTEIIDLVEKIGPMYEEDNDISIDYGIIDKTDEKFKELYSENKLYDLTAKFIKNNLNVFID